MRMADPSKPLYSSYVNTQTSFPEAMNVMHSDRARLKHICFN
jgi:hypothetical protein